ncbi:uncharacterized protein [Palaemon carinicauda]|uniref:uncharacterized protein n=1 Tax=Palaemon carinicauda TaxID=392227 RepID=UPI0035B5EC03
MFYQVKVPVSDRDYLRYFWWENGNISKRPDTYRLCVHLFGAESSPSVATYALQRTVQVNASSFDQAVKDNVLNNFYVDDNLKAHDDENELAQIAKRTRELCSLGGFYLTKYVTSSREIINTMPRQAFEVDMIKFLDHNSKLLPQKVLSINWYVELNELFVSFKLPCEIHTTRELLREIAAKYDPLGFAAPFIFEGKAILQETCRQGLKWDEPFTDDLRRRIRKWLGPNEKIKVSVQRNVIRRSESLQLHLFCNASLKGYVIVAYLKSNNARDFVKELTPDDLDEAEFRSAKYVQSCHYGTEIVMVSQQKELKLNSLQKLKPFVDMECVLRVGGRLSMATLPFSSRHPVILPSKDHFTDLMIRDIHKRVGHMGPTYVFSQLRSKYWVVRGSKAVRRVLSQCIEWRKLKAPMLQQQMADLPNTN